MKNIYSIQKLQKKFQESKDKIISQYQDWDHINDSRVTVFSKFINVCNSTHLSFILIHSYLANPIWWNQMNNPKISLEDAQIYCNEYDMFTKMGFIQFSFSSIESTLRIFIKSLDPNACDNGTADFKSVYACILKRLDLKIHESKLDLLRLIRNTIHNNGVYNHKNDKDESVVYKDKVYNFKIGKPVDFVTWEFIFEVMEDLNVLIMDIVQSKEISAKDRIVDPFAQG